MLAVILNLLAAVPAVTAALPEFEALIDRVGDTLDSDDQQTLQEAYALARQDSDAANEDLKALIASRLAGQG